MAKVSLLSGASECLNRLRSEQNPVGTLCRNDPCGRVSFTSHVAKLSLPKRNSGHYRCARVAQAGNLYIPRRSLQVFRSKIHAFPFTMAATSTATSYLVPGQFSLLYLCENLPHLYRKARTSTKEAASSSFAIAFVRELMKEVNARRKESGNQEYKYNYPPEQHPAVDNNRRIDFDVQGYKRNARGEVESFVLIHVEVKKHSASAGKDLEILENQAMTACEATNQPLVYAITFWGTAFRIFCYTRGTFYSLLQDDSHDIGDRSLWVDADTRDSRVGSVLQALSLIVEFPPFAMIPKEEL